ncbi:MAG: cupin domain-containing protein [Gaiellales bacterium]
MAGFEVQGDSLGTDVSVIVVEAEPGDGPALHRHPYAELFVVIEGEATFTVGGLQRRVTAGETLLAPAGVPHAFRNTGDRALRQVDIHLSPVFETEWL